MVNNNTVFPAFFPSNQSIEVDILIWAASQVIGVLSLVGFSPINHAASLGYPHEELETST